MSEMNRRTLVKGAAIGTAAAAVPAAAAAVPGATAAAVKSGRAKRVDVAVVGAGMAGLYAADLLRKAGKSVVVLEASHRVGGRVHNLTVGPERNDIAEAGAEWIAPSQPHMQKLVKRFGLKTYKNYTKGKSTLIIDGKVSRFDGATIPTLPNGGTKQLIKAFGELTKMAKEVPVDAPWKAPNALEWDQQTGQTWIDANISDPVARDFAGIAIGGPASVAPGDISLLHYLFIAQASGGPLSLVSIGSGDLSDRIKGGTGRLVEGLAKTLRHHIHLKTPVTMIERSRSKVRLTTPDGAWVANDAILAMSPTITQQILFDPALPVHREQSVQRTGNGSCVKCFPVYSKPFWRDQGLNGIIQSNSTPFSGVFDNSPPDGSIGVLFALVENKHARRFARISPAERKAKVLDGLALALGPKARNPIRWREYDWDTQPWLRGGACSFFAPGVLTEYRYLFDKPIGRLHFAGTETGRDFWGNMESAAASGERAVGEILG